MTDATIVGSTADCAIADFNKLKIVANEKGLYISNGIYIYF